MVPGDTPTTHPYFSSTAGQNRRSWDNTAHAVTQAGWHAITVDHRGHGDSDWPKAADYDFDDFDDFADDVLDFIDTLRPGSWPPRREQPAGHVPADHEHSRSTVASVRTPFTC